MSTSDQTDETRTLTFARCAEIYDDVRAIELYADALTTDAVQIELSTWKLERLTDAFEGLRAPEARQAVIDYITSHQFAPLAIVEYILSFPDELDPRGNFLANLLLTKLATIEWRVEDVLAILARLQEDYRDGDERIRERVLIVTVHGSLESTARTSGWTFEDWYAVYRAARPMHPRTVCVMSAATRAMIRLAQTIYHAALILVLNCFSINVGKLKELARTATIDLLVCSLDRLDEGIHASEGGDESDLPHLQSARDAIFAELRRRRTDVPTDDPAPSGAAPDDPTPSGAAPDDSAPSGSVPDGSPHTP